MPNEQRPKLAQRLLTWLLKEELAEEVLGDLDEQFADTAKRHSLHKARRRYWYQTLHYLRPFAIKPLFRLPHIPVMLIQHTLLMAYRQFRRYRGTFLINLVGLASGLTCALLIYFWINDELSIDAFHMKGDRIYQAMLHHEESGSLRTGPDVPLLLADALEAEIPAVEMAVEDTEVEWFNQSFSVKNGDQRLKRQGKFSGVGYFDLFSFPLLYGDPATALRDPNHIVISRQLAHTLFGGVQAAMGQTVEWQLLHFENSAVVVGVFDDIPDNSTNQFDFLLSIELFKKIIGQDAIQWGNYNGMTYVLLQQGTDADALNAQLARFIKEKREESNTTLFLRPYSEGYLYSRYENGVLTGGRIDYVHLFGFIALFIIVIACINFMNLSTAQAARRLKEVGVKKTLGAQRGSLIFQYLGESTLLTLMALLLALWLTRLFLPQFNEITDKQLELALSMSDALVLLGITLGTGLLAGSYPALYLSRFRPVAVLRRRQEAKGGEAWVRRGLVVFQFALSVILMVAVTVVYQQIEFTQTKQLGYDKEHLAYFPIEGRVTKNIDGFIEGLNQLPGVVAATATGHTGVENKGGGYTTGVDWPGKNPGVEIKFENAGVYYDAIETLGIEVIAGRSFSRDLQGEDQRLLINETAAAIMGLDEPIHARINLWGKEQEIIGLVKDFHMGSLHRPVEPMFFRLREGFLPYILVKFAPGQAITTMQRIQAYYTEFNPGFALDYRFLDQTYQKLYQAEQRVSVLSRYFAGLAILISCLGLLGLATYLAERRTKEVGIRKVLGARPWQLVWLLSREFAQLVLLAVLIGLPIGYWLVQEWLANFAYHIEPSVWLFVLAGAVALFIAGLTVGIRTWQATGIDPARCLRDE